MSVYRDGVFLETYPVSYIDAKQGTVPIAPLQENVADDYGTDHYEEEFVPDTGYINSGSSNNVNTNSSSAKSVAKAANDTKGKGQKKAAKQTGNNNK
ncbi:hypothetical protein D3C77_668130 [compost metagenome]